MKCLYCNAEIPMGSKFCMCCGKKILLCPKCKYGPLPSNAVYCPNCGEKLVSPSILSSIHAGVRFEF